MDWTPDVEGILESIRTNSVILSETHKINYYKLKGYLKYFRIPLIIFSALNSVFAVGLQPYMKQNTVSVINCIISLLCGIITSIELFLAVQKQMEAELISSKDFYLLSIDIFKTLALDREHRSMKASVYLDETYNSYCKLIESSNLTTKKLKDKLAPIDTKLLKLTPVNSVNSTTSSIDNEIV